MLKRLSALTQQQLNNSRGLLYCQPINKELMTRGFKGHCGSVAGSASSTSCWGLTLGFELESYLTRYFHGP